MATSKLFKKVPITVPGRSGFNMSHNNFFSAPVGTLVPNLVDFLLPGDEIDLSSKSHVQLPPMATDFYGRIEYKEEAFFVPCRILFGGWKDFYVNPVDGTTNPSNIDGQLAKYLIGAKLVSQVNYTPVEHSTSQVSFNQGAWDSTEPNVSNGITVIRSFIEQLITDSLAAYNDNNLSFFFGDFNAESDLEDNVSAGSLADYLGFKVASKTPVGGSVQLLRRMVELFLIALQNSAEDLILQLYNSTIYSEEEEVSFPWTSLNPGYLVQSSDGTVDFKLNPSPDQVSISFRMFSSVVTGSESMRTTMYYTYSYPGVSNVSVSIPNILPFMAYHKIYDDWYRAPMIQQSLFKRNVANQSTATTVANMPWITSGAQDKIYFTGDQLNFANGHNLFELHQRNWQKDYFTSATPEPQAGDASSVKFDVVNDSGEFTIASLRAANALQQWLDRNNIGGFRYGDMIYAQYGVYPSDATTDRAIYLGSSSVEVYNKSIYQQSGDGGTNTNNPFNAIGSKYSNPTGVGNGTFCNNYQVTEAGFVMKIGSLVPQAYYGTGVRRMFNYNDISDIAFPVLAGVGDQPIYGRELSDVYSGVGDDTVFGYQQRYAEYKFIDDQVHGLLRDGESLASFALQRTFSDVPELGSSFLEIPRDYLDQVSATDYKLSQYGCWVNCYNDYRKSSKLPAYSIPTLEDMKGHTVLVDKGGTYLA